MKDYYTFYKATNKQNGKVYIGVTGKTIQERIESHKQAMKKINKPQFVRALEQYGIEGFEWKEITTAKKYYKELGQDYNHGEHDAKGFEMELINMMVEKIGRENVYNEITSWAEYYEKNPNKKRQWSKYEKPKVVEKQTIIEKPIIVTKEVVKEVEKPVIVEKQVIVEKPVDLSSANHRIFSPLQASFVVIFGVVCASLIFVYVRGGSEESIGQNSTNIQFSTCKEAKQAGYRELTQQQVRELGIETRDGDKDGVYCE